MTILPGRQFTGAGGLPGTTISQASAGVPSASEALDRFGSALAAGEATGDSFAELVVGAPGEDSTTPEPGSGIGAVTFFRGATAGVSGTGSRLWTQDSAGVSGVRGSGDAFGAALAMGHLDPGSLADVAIGAPGDAVSGVPGAGSVTVLRGSTEGLTTAGVGGAQFHQNVAGVSGSAETGDAFGRAVTAAPIQTAGRDSLVVGVPGESVRRVRDGMVQQLTAGTAGPDGAGSRSVHLDTAGVQGVPADEDALGFSVG